jgi:hypothetical protein
LDPFYTAPLVGQHTYGLTLELLFLLCWGIVLSSPSLVLRCQDFARIFNAKNTSHALTGRGRCESMCQDLWETIDGTGKSQAILLLLTGSLPGFLHFPEHSFSSFVNQVVPMPVSWHYRVCSAERIGQFVLWESRTLAEVQRGPSYMGSVALCCLQPLSPSVPQFTIKSYPAPAPTFFCLCLSYFSDKILHIFAQAALDHGPPT